MNATPRALDSTDDAAAAIRQGLSLHRQGRCGEAGVFYASVLQRQPLHTQALHLMGLVALQTQDVSRAVDLFNRALTQQPDDPVVHNHLGNAQLALGDTDGALASYAQAIALEAGYADAYYNRGNAFLDGKRFEAALANYDQAIACRADFVAAYSNRGLALSGLGRHTAALASFDQAIAHDPRAAEAHHYRGNALRALGELDAAVASFDRALACSSAYAEAYNGKGGALYALKQHDAALDALNRALALNPHFFEAHSNRGNVLGSLQQWEAALQSYERAIELNPASAVAYSNRANALFEMKRFAAAIDSCNRALAIDPLLAEAYVHRGNAQKDLGDYAAAIASYDAAIAIDPTLKTVQGLRLYARIQICEWQGLDADLAALAARVQAGDVATPPFPLFALLDRPGVQHQAATAWMQEHWPPNPSLPSLTGWPQRERIKIGYFSADFYNHATAYLMAGLLESHDAARFEVMVFAFGTAAPDAMTQRLQAAVPAFFDVRSRSDREVAQLARDLQLDIAIDLKGFTRDARPGIFALRAAPLQVGYLGYPGTLGGPYLDYLIADRVLIPEAGRPHYSEKIIYMPDSYQANDARRAIDPRPVSREEWGLPAAGFVFCSFNNSFKITPAMFEVWMRLLAQVEGSVLWLLEDNALAVGNLRREAVRRGIGAKRLVFAARAALPLHLARHRAADLFLDTLPCNAHTTASDALWAGLPLLTCVGEAFPGRVAASLLHAVGLPELVTSSLAQYEARAVELATHPAQLAALRERLAVNRATAPLFDTRRHTRHLEAAFTALYARQQANLPPADLDFGGHPS